MPHLVTLAGLAVSWAGAALAATDTCLIGSYYDSVTSACQYCTNVPLNGYYTANGNFKNECPYELCEVCPNGQYNMGCGYDDQNRDAPSICFGMTGYSDICSAGPKYCTVQPTVSTSWATCSAYCTAQKLTCLASYTSTAGGCNSGLQDLTKGSCTATMSSKMVCDCHLASCSADLLTTGVLRCPYYTDATRDYCPGTTSKATDANQIFATQNCRVTCNACVTGNTFTAGGTCTKCTDITSTTVGKYYSTDGDRSDQCAISDCTKKCFLGEYNAGCGFNSFSEDTFSCALCKSTCGVGKYISKMCDGQGFAETTTCANCATSCSIGEYIAAKCDGTATFDSTVCEACTAACNPGYYMDGSVCTGKTTSSSATCTECTKECAAGKFPSGSCDGSGWADGVTCKSCYTDCDKDCGTDCDCFEPCFTVTVLGGSGNWALNTFDAVGGGQSNQAGYLASDGTIYGKTDYFNVVVGGNLNTVGGTYSSLTGGKGNKAFGNGNAIAGGLENVVVRLVSTKMDVTLTASAVGGGKKNTVNQPYSVIIGGSTNTVDFAYSGALGGELNICSGEYSVVIGGDTNSVRGSWAGVAGGKLNKAWSNYATVAGGYLGKASSRFSVVFGGSKNTAKGRYSFAAGFTATAGRDFTGVLGFTGLACIDNGIGTFNICADYVYINGYDVTALLESASGKRSRRLSDGTEVDLGNDAEMRRLARDRGYTLEAYELEYEVMENDNLLKSIDQKMEAATAALQELRHFVQPASLRSR